MIKKPNKKIIKLKLNSEPSGRFVLGEIKSNQQEILNECIRDKTISEEILKLRNDFDNCIIDIEGIFSYGNNGDWGKEGKIEIKKKIDIIDLKNGIYFCYLSLNSATQFISFGIPKFLEFDNKYFLESSVKVNLPESIANCFEMYSADLEEFNVIEDFKYKDKKIDWHCDGYFTNADVELFVIFSTNNGKSNILYSDYHGDIRWSS
tara:strand:+ start:332 stop:949 length:618 start_codon:yes stop_codon:yes gene_type:complete